MSFVTKMLEAAARMSHLGPSSDLERRLKDALAPLTAPERPGGSRGLDPQDLPTSCFGSPAAFGDGLARTLRAARPGARDLRPATDDGLEARVHREAYGSRTYRLFVPNQGRPPAGLVLLLHGCTQTAADFAAGTRMHALARNANVAVAYPEQPRSANPSQCWNWFEPGHQGRDGGEPGLLAGLARTVAAELEVPPSRIFAAGLSAGAAMTAILAETYPDVFAAVGLHSGLPFGVARDVTSALAAMRGPVPPGGATARAEGRIVPAIVFQGDADRTVHPANARAIVDRIKARAPGLVTTVERGTAPNGHAYTREIGRTGAGDVLVEHWTLTGAGHAWSGGSAAGTHTDPSGPNASAEMLRFFLDRA